MMMKKKNLISELNRHISHISKRFSVAAELTEDAAFAQRAGVLLQQPGVHAVSVVLVKTRQHPQTLTPPDKHTDPLSTHTTGTLRETNSVKSRRKSDLVVVERLQTDGAVVRLGRLGRVAPQFGLTIGFGLEGGHSLQDVLLGKELQDIRRLNLIKSNERG